MLEGQGAADESGQAVLEGGSTAANERLETSIGRQWATETRKEQGQKALHRTAHLAGLRRSKRGCIETICRVTSRAAA